MEEKILPVVTPTVTSSKNFVELPDDQMIVIFDGMKEYLGVHEPLFDDFGEIIECRLVKWNRAYSAVRNNVVTRGQSLIETYYDPLDALQYVNRAWKEGSCEQIFFLGDDVHDKYRNVGEIVYITVVWQRVGNFVLEMGNDLSDFKKLQLKTQAQEIAVLEAESHTLVLEERERIEREMHDSIIQQLYAASLTLHTILIDVVQKEISPQLLGVADLIDKTIIEIREQIIKVNYSPIFDVRNEILNSLESIISGSNIQLTVDVVEDLYISSAVAPHFRSIIKEATSNAIRHGHATNIVYSCTDTDGNLHVTITDDGEGLSPEFRFGSGLINMRRRAELLGGWVEVAENTPHGTRILWAVPNVADGLLS